MLKLVSQEKLLNYNDVCLVPQRTTLSSRKEVELERTYKFYHSPREWTGIPIISSNMSCVTGRKLTECLAKRKMIGCLHKYHTVDQLEDILRNIHSSYAWPSIGMHDDDISKLLELSTRLNYAPNICIDVPSAYLEKFVGFCKKVRDAFPASIIMAGNVSTPEMAQELIISGGVDIVKLNIGPGKNCETSSVTGIACGTITTASECSHAAHGLKNGNKKLGLVCSDGGMRTSGDICKSFCAGADFVMLGSMFAGFDENSDVAEYEDGKQIIYGMSTHKAQEKHGQGKKSYRASEGKVTKIELKGSIEPFLDEVLGGIRSCCTYIGATSIKDMPKCAKFALI